MNQNISTFDLFYSKNKTKKDTIKNNVDLQGIIKEVNKFDKKYGIKLKHKDIMSDPKKYRRNMELSYDFILGGLICILNGVDYKEYQRPDSSGFIRPNGIMGSYFMEASNLKWGLHEKYPVDSYIFKCRFLTLILMRLLGESNRLANRTNDENQITDSYEERKIVEIKKILDNVLRYVKLVLKGEPYRNTGLIIFGYIAKLDDKENGAFISKKIAKAIMEVDKGTIVEFMSQRRFLDDDMIIDDLLQISHALSLLSLNFKTKKLPSFKDIEGATLSHDLRKLIGAYGNRIMNKKPKSSMFEMFLMASPQVMTDFGEKKSDLVTGCYALEFTGFMMNARQIDFILEDMMRKGN